MATNFHVIIIGAGIGGLTLGLALCRKGHCVTILEQAKQLSDVGAGIQLAPNATRILSHVGVLSTILEHANQPSGLIVRRYADDSEIGPRSHNKKQSRFAHPMLVMHRADLQQVLVNAALAAGVNLRTNACVREIDLNFNARAILTSGEVVTGHALIGADGINSRVRARLADRHGLADVSTSTGDCAYRITIPRSRLLGYPEILSSVDEGMSTRWLGPKGHIMAYPLRDNKLYNVVMVHASPNTSTDETNLWSRKGNFAELSRFYGSWGPMVKDLTNCVDHETLMQWPLNKRPKLPAWTENCTSLLGDACHAMLPYVAQGAAQAIEDAATLAVCLTSIPNVPQALLVYEGLRKPRAEFIQSCAQEMRRVLHFPDGPEQADRDRTMRAERGPGWKHPDLWADPAFQDLVWGYDAVGAAEEKCRAVENIYHDQNRTSFTSSTHSARGSGLMADQNGNPVQHVLTSV